MAKTREQRKREVAISKKFVPAFWETVDGRYAIAKEIRRRHQLLKLDAGAESYQKDLICQRAIFLAVQLETMEVEATESGHFDSGVYTQMSNALLGHLKALGLERRVKEGIDLESYLAEQAK